VAIETEVGRLEIPERGEQQQRAGQQEQRERHLRSAHIVSALPLGAAVSSRSDGTFARDTRKAG